MGCRIKRVVSTLLCCALVSSILPVIPLAEESSSWTACNRNTIPSRPSNNRCPNNLQMSITRLPLNRKSKN